MKMKACGLAVCSDKCQGHVLDLEAVAIAIVMAKIHESLVIITLTRTIGALHKMACLHFVQEVIIMTISHLV